MCNFNIVGKHSFSACMYIHNHKPNVRMQAIFATHSVNIIILADLITLEVYVRILSYVCAYVVCTVCMCICM